MYCRSLPNVLCEVEISNPKKFTMSTTIGDTYNSNIGLEEFEDIEDIQSTEPSTSEASKHPLMFFGIVVLLFTSISIIHLAAKCHGSLHSVFSSSVIRPLDLFRHFHTVDSRLQCYTPSYAHSTSQWQLTYMQLSDGGNIYQRRWTEKTRD